MKFNSIFLLLLWLPLCNHPMEKEELSLEKEILGATTRYQPSSLKNICLKELLEEDDHEQLTELFRKVSLPNEIILNTAKSIIQKESNLEKLIPFLTKLPPYFFPALQLFITTSPLGISLYNKSKILTSMRYHKNLNEDQKVILNFFEKQYDRILDQSSNNYIIRKARCSDLITPAGLIKKACNFNTSEPLHFLIEQGVQFPEKAIMSILHIDNNNLSPEEKLDRLKLLLQKGAPIRKRKLMSFCSQREEHINACKDFLHVPEGPLSRVATMLCHGNPESETYAFYMKVDELFNQFDK